MLMHEHTYKQVKGIAGTFDGSLCELKGQVLDVFQKSMSIEVSVPKPCDSKDIPFLLDSKSGVPNRLITCFCNM